MSNENSKLIDFWEMLDEYTIEIPMIQRDYAQGRREHGKIRSEFLLVLKESLITKTKTNLDFVYGNINSNIFQPLDGQQRLTTLFLLHWYAYSKLNICDESIENKLIKFKYQTRISSREFCEMLVKNPISFPIDASVSDVIIDAKWFFDSWKRDSSIKAMLKTLDDINTYFNDVKDLWGLLVNEKLLSFYMLILENFGLSDDLYIKMNARGKLLTSFENFKAKLHKKIQDKEWEANAGLTKDFSLMLDTKWTDFLWNNYKYKNSVDIAHMRFLTTSALIGIGLGYHSMKTDERNRAIQDLQNRVLDSNLIGYITEDMFRYICKCYDMYSDLDMSSIDVSIDFPMWSHKSSKDLLNDMLLEGTHSFSYTSSYTRKVLFFAQTQYLMRCGDDFSLEKFKNWMRVIRNIVSRANISPAGERVDIVRDQDSFVRAISLVNELSDGCLDIYNYLSRRESLNSNFLPTQTKEEIIKARFMCQYPKMQDCVFSLEDNELNRGCILLSLECAGYNGNDIDSIDIALLEKIKNIYMVYFNDENCITDEFRRAMLTIEVNGLYEFYNYWNSEWIILSCMKKRLFYGLRELEYFVTETKKFNGRDYFKKMIKCLLENNYSEIIERFIVPETMPNWKAMLIKEPGYLAQCESKHIAIPLTDPNSCCYLLKTRRPRDESGAIKIM